MVRSFSFYDILSVSEIRPLPMFEKCVSKQISENENVMN